MSSGYGFATRAIHGAHYRGADPGNPIVFPIFQTASFAVDSTAEQEAIAAGTLRGYAYSRLSNPTVAAFERVVADLEGADTAAAFASGMAAIHAAMTALVGVGDHVLCTRDVYGGTYHLLTEVLPQFGVSHSFVDMTDLAAVQRGLRATTKLLWAETITNPTTVVLDLPALAAVAHAHGARLGVDATLTSPYLSLPLAQGADLVAHSATKYLSGHGDVLAGVVSGSGPVMDHVRGVQTGVGGNLAPLEAFLLLRGLKTLELRLDRHGANALALAQALQRHPRVERVFYPGLPEHPQHALAQRLFRAGNGGGLLSFAVRGDEAAARAVVDRLVIARRASSLGDVDTLASLPVMTSHRLMSPADRAACGVTPNLIRVPVGLETVADLIADFTQALDG